MVEGVCYDTKEDLLNNDLVPYKYLLEKDLLPTVMVGHTLYPNIDPDYPASLSKKYAAYKGRILFLSSLIQVKC